MRDTTLVFLTQKGKICLAMKKRGFGIGRWNGVGGKAQQGESIECAAIREAAEEIGVMISNIDGHKALNKVAELEFLFAHNAEWNQLVHVYLCEQWRGDPVESEEMRPEWFDYEDIPFKEMWPDDPLWLPKVIAGDRLRASFTFGEGDVILKQNIEIIDGFNPPLL
jgi:8-oxo-dGTP pyrophosphatase MutT (NUDIX family)